MSAVILTERLVPASTETGEAAMNYSISSLKDYHLTAANRWLGYVDHVYLDKRTVDLTLPRELVKHAQECGASHPPDDLEQRLVALRRPENGAVSQSPTLLR